MPNSALMRGLHNFYCFILRKLLYAEVGRKAGRTAVVRAWYSLLNLFPHTWTFRLMDALTSRYRGAKMVRHLSFPMPKGRAYGFMRDWFENLEDIGFEGREFPGISDYHSFLANHYGDYMQVPPPDKRHFHPVSKFALPNE